MLREDSIEWKCLNLLVERTDCFEKTPLNESVWTCSSRERIVSRSLDWARLFALVRGERRMLRGVSIEWKLLEAVHRKNTLVRESSPEWQCSNLFMRKAECFRKLPFSESVLTCLWRKWMFLKVCIAWKCLNLFVVKQYCSENFSLHESVWTYSSSHFGRKWIPNDISGDWAIDSASQWRH